MENSSDALVSNSQLVQKGLENLESEIENLMQRFHEVLASNGAGDVAGQLPWIEDLEGDPDSDIYSISFQLLDLCEEQISGETRALREKTLGAAAEKGLWAHCLESLKSNGLSEQDIVDVLSKVRVEPVFTAHPTEAKRPSVRERHRDLYQALLDFRAHEDKEKVNLAIEALYHTGEIHVEKPTIEKELRNVIYYLREVFPDTVKAVDQRFEAAWLEAGFSKESLKEISIHGPSLRFGLWIGGDRDGHPFVTAEVTHSTLESLRKHAVKLYRRELEIAAQHLTISVDHGDVPLDLSQRIKELSVVLGDTGAYIVKRNPNEPWRAYGYLIRAILESELNYPVDQLRSDLELYERSLRDIKANRLADSYVKPIRKLLSIFGMHLADLDIRQNSEFHDKAVSQLLEAAGIEGGENFSDWPETRRVDFLSEELESPRPFLARDHSAGQEADTVRECYNVLARQWREHGEGLGSLIVSMTRQLSDLLVVQLFAREAGFTESSAEGPVCPLPIVPLFETLDDLNRSSGIIESWFKHPVAKRSFAFNGKMQQIMLGYSDSNKDGGIFASQWALQKAQRSITETAERHDIDIRFFHGRGGTISRGAGPTNWFLRALPHGSLSGSFRMTEQGESIAQKYAYPDNAVYHIESLLASVTHTTAVHQKTSPPEEPGIDLMPQLAEWSEKAYRELIESDRFIEFYRQASIIDALEQTEMGSRPARRTGTASLDDLRAIPWVFSWTQSRFYLPGWYGIGTALDKLQKESPDQFDHLCQTIRKSTFPRYVFTSLETNLVSADWDLMNSYASLVEDESLRENFMNRIGVEMELAKSGLNKLFQKSIEERRPRFIKTLELRDAPLRKLHLQQVEQLREWRATGEEIPQELLVSISAIASGLRTTG